MIILRYADDIVVGFEHEADAHRFLDAMRTRPEEFALTPRSASRLEPEKTRLIEFGRHATADREKRGLGKPETFNFLGFTFICGKSRRGDFLVKRKTRRDRMMAKLLEVKEELRRRTLRRRSQKDRFSWDRITRLVDDWLPKPRVLHPWPSVRFAVRHPRWEPYAGKPHVRFCAGGRPVMGVPTAI
jgi:hypothetical protein